MAGRERDKCDNALTLELVGAANHSGFGDGGMTHK